MIAFSCNQDQMIVEEDLNGFDTARQDTLTDYSQYTVLLNDDHNKYSRETYRTVHISYKTVPCYCCYDCYTNSSYRARYYRINANGTMVAFNSGNLVSGSVSIPLTWSSYLCAGKRSIVIVPDNINQVSCKSMRIRVAGDWHGVCQNPNNPYIDEDFYPLVAGLEHGFKILVDDINNSWCQNENFITEGMSCGTSYNPYCSNEQ